MNIRASQGKIDLLTYNVVFGLKLYLLPYFTAFLQAVKSLARLPAMTGFPKCTIFQSGLQRSVHNQKIFFLFLKQDIYCGYSKEPSQWGSSFEHLQHMFKLMDKKVFTILRQNFYLLKSCKFNWAGSYIVAMFWNWSLLEINWPWYSCWCISFSLLLNFIPLGSHWHISGVLPRLHTPAINI